MLSFFSTFCLFFLWLHLSFFSTFFWFFPTFFWFYLVQSSHRILKILQTLVFIQQIFMFLLFCYFILTAAINWNEISFCIPLLIFSFFFTDCYTFNIFYIFIINQIFNFILQIARLILFFYNFFFIQLLFYLFIWLLIFCYIYLLTHLLICLFVHLLIYSFIYHCIYWFTYFF